MKRNNKTAAWLVALMTAFICLVSSVSAVTMYAPDGRTEEVAEGQVEAWKAVGWYTEPFVAMHSMDGREIKVQQSLVAAYENVGWYRPVTMYAPDGRSECVKIYDVEAWKTVGWYTEPVMTVYADDGRTLVIPKSKLADYENVGWHAPVKIYAPNGSTMEVAPDRVNAWLNGGWYREPVMTVYANDGSTKVIPVASLQTYKNAGWQETEPMISLYAADGKSISVRASETWKYTNDGWYKQPVMTVYDEYGEPKVIYQSELSSYLASGYTRQPGTRWYREGEYSVGTDIPAGDYYLVCTESFGGYYCKYTDSSKHIIDHNESFDTFTYVRATDGQYLKLSDCKMTEIGNAPKVYPDDNDGYGEGMYRVGTDIPAGDYYATVTSGNGGYYSKYTDITKSDIEDSNNFSTFTYFRAYSGQYLKLSNCHIVPISHAPEPDPISENTYGEGMYIVGIDIPAGDYKFVATGSDHSGYYTVYTDITYGNTFDTQSFGSTKYCTVWDGQFLEVKNAKAIYIPEPEPEPEPSYTPSYSVPYYSRFYGIPDFGKVTGAKLMETASTASSYGYYYHLGFDTDEISNYCETLMDCGFKFAGGFDDDYGSPYMVFENSRLGYSVVIGVASPYYAFLVMVTDY